MTASPLQRWRAVARRAAHFQSRALLFVIYYVLWCPLALMRRPFADPLSLKRPPGWRPASPPDADVSSARRQS